MEHLLSAVAGLLFVLGLFFLLAWALKKYGGPVLAGTPKRGGKQQIELLDMRLLDAENRLALVRCRNKEYLIAVGKNAFTVDSYPVFEQNGANAKDEPNAIQNA